jgi:predicted TIM-barrel fold metal-dependent hydrolase
MTTIIDIHPHVIADDPKRYPLAPLGGHQSDWSRTRPVTTEQMIAAMDEAGVTKSATVQGSTCYGHDNSYVADAVAAHPDRFTGVSSVLTFSGRPELDICQDRTISVPGACQIEGDHDVRAR